jgi:cell pole-organizing protein PopZ
MSAEDAQSEPTMEEILASIRRIISEDDTAAAPEEEVKAPAPKEVVPDFEDDVLELNEPIMDTDDRVDSDFDFSALPVENEAPAEEIIVEDRWNEPASTERAEPPMTQAARAPSGGDTAKFPFDQGLVSDPTADRASSVFAKLAPHTTLPGVFLTGNTVEAMVGELLKPMLREWLDANLPRIVAEKVEAEVARIARRSF